VLFQAKFHLCPVVSSGEETANWNKFEIYGAPIPAPSTNNTTTAILWPFVRHYPSEPVPEETLTHPPSWSSSNLYQLLHLPRSIASSLFKLCTWQSFCTTSFHVLFGVPLHLEPSTSYSTHFFTQSVSSFHNTCPYHRNLFCCNINTISSISSLSLNSLLGTLSFTLTLHIHLTILISARWSATSFLTDHCNATFGYCHEMSSVCRL